MPHLTKNHEIDAYYLTNSAQPRAAGVMWPTLVENRIDALFEIGLRPDKEVWNDLFRSGGSLGNYGVKIRLGYMLGWFSKDFYRDLILISKIRNRFAHSIEVKDFADAKISSWLKEMTVYQKFTDMLSEGEKRAEQDRSLQNLLFVSVLKHALEDEQAGFRLCIDLMLGKLDDYAANMKKNLTELNSNWLVAAKTA